MAQVAQENLKTPYILWTTEKRREKTEFFNLPDLDLILAFHCSGRSTEVTKQLLDLHFTIRTIFTSFFKDRVYDYRIQTAFEKVLVTTPLPQRSPEGYAIYYTRLLDKDTKNFVVADCYRAALMRLDLWQLEEGSWPGLMLLIDLEDMTLGHLTRIDPHGVQQFLYYVQEALLVNLKGFHLLNAPSFMDRLMLLLRPFLKKEMLSMLHIHQVGSRTLDQFYPMEHLPKGAMMGVGQGPSLQELKEANISKMAAGKEYFQSENLKRVTESKRPGKPKTISDIFGGVEGSFKKLEID